jgi:hypothetical protein
MTHSFSAASPRAVVGQEDLILGTHSEVVMNVFLFGQPELYFESVHLMFVLIAFYIALWLVVVVSESPTHLWKFISVLPAILICCFFFYIVKTAALLKAIYEVDTDTMLEVIEETEAAQQLSEELRAKVVSHMASSEQDTYVQLEQLYKQIDVNGNNSLSRAEFGTFMKLLNITFSAKKWERIYKEIDRNYDNEISFQEFFLFLFPDHDLAQSLEMRRLKVISRRVMTRANYFLSHLSPFRDMPVISDRLTSLSGPKSRRIGAGSPSRPAPETSISNRDFASADQRADTLARLAARSVKTCPPNKPLTNVEEGGHDDEAAAED